MPPPPPQKRKNLLKFHCRCKTAKHTGGPAEGPSAFGGAGGACNTNPHVVIAPLDVSSGKTYRFTALPAAAALYNKPESSDIRLIVGGESFHAHRCILSAASDVFLAMLGSDWLPSGFVSLAGPSHSDPLTSYRIARSKSGVSALHPFGALSQSNCSFVPPPLDDTPEVRTDPSSGETAVAGSKVAELELVEEPECGRVFDRFLYFMYSGTVVIGDSYVVPLYILADKYNVRALYDECAKIIQNGLKVFKVVRPPTVAAASLPSATVPPRWPPRFLVSSESSDTMSDYSDGDDSGGGGPPAGGGVLPSGEQQGAQGVSSYTAPLAGASSFGGGGIRLVPSETFPVTLVLRLVGFNQDAAIRSAALRNLEARLGNQLALGNHALWSELRTDVLVDVLSDARFCHGEAALFDAAKIWLNARPERVADPSTVTTVLSTLRYPLMSVAELYRVDADPLIGAPPGPPGSVRALVDRAIRYSAFQGCAGTGGREEWTGVQFEKRVAP